MIYECYKKYVHFSTPSNISDDSTVGVEVDELTTSSPVDMRSQPPPGPGQTDLL